MVHGLMAFGAAVAGVPQVPAEVLSQPTVVPSHAETHQFQSSLGHPFTLIEYPGAIKGGVPHIIAIDSGDHVWFSESGGRFAKSFLDIPAQSKIGKLDQLGTISEWDLKDGSEVETAHEGTSPMGILFDTHGTLWIAERLANRISSMSHSGEVRHYNIPTLNAWPTGLVVDSAGNLWFTETKGDKDGFLDAGTGKMIEYPLPLQNTMSTGIAIGPDGSIWVAERDVDTIGRLNPKTHSFTQYQTPTKNSRPCGLLVDRQGKIWFSERNGGKLATISSDGQITEIPLEDRFAAPFLMVSDERGQIWFSEIFANRIGRFDPQTYDVEYYPLSSKDAHPAGLALDSKGNLWIAEQGTDRIAVLVRTDLSYIGNGVGVHEKQRAVTPAPEAQYRFEELDVPTVQSIPGIVAVSAEDTVWFTQMGGGFVGPGFPPGAPGSKVGYIVKGVLHELPVGPQESGPTSMAKDPCSKDLWVTLRSANKIARIRDYKAVDYEIPIADSLPVGIAVDLDHNVWVALSAVNKIARLSPEGKWRFLDVLEPNAQPRTVLVDKSNRVWFAEKTGNHIGLIDKDTWTAKTWNIPTRLAWPLSLETDKDGKIWFAEMRGDKLTSFDLATEHFTEFPLPFKSAPFKLLYDPDHDAFWISTVFASSIMRFSISQQKLVTSYKIPSEGAWVGGLDMDRSEERR